jgi:hypothetical protein
MYIKTNEHNIGLTRDVRTKKRCFIHHEETNRLIDGWKLDVRTMDGWWDGWIDVCMDIPFVVTTVFLLQRCRNQVNELET